MIIGAFFRVNLKVCFVVVDDLQRIYLFRQIRFPFTHTHPAGVVVVVVMTWLSQVAICIHGLDSFHSIFQICSWSAVRPICNLSAHWILLCVASMRATHSMASDFYYNFLSNFSVAQFSSWFEGNTLIISIRFLYSHTAKTSDRNEFCTFNCRLLAVQKEQLERFTFSWHRLVSQLPFNLSIWAIQMNVIKFKWWLILIDTLQQSPLYRHQSRTIRKKQRNKQRFAVE